MIRAALLRITALLAALLVVLTGGAALAHPLGNFTINRFARLEIGPDRAGVRYVVDMAEIPAFQEIQRMHAGEGAPTDAEISAWAREAATRYAGGLSLVVDGVRVSLAVTRAAATMPAGAGGLPTLRFEADLSGALPAAPREAARKLSFDDENHKGRVGWREIVVKPGEGVSVFDSSAFGSAITDELRAYPTDSLAAPLDERRATLRFSLAGPPFGAAPLRTREGAALTPRRDRLAELITVPELTPLTVLGALLIALLLGGMHALSPGHGKTVVGAYLVGSRGTVKHAIFLGATVTITHTAGVFALGLMTLFASNYILPERLVPILSLASGVIVVIVGASLLVRRARSLAGGSESALVHAHDGVSDHSHEPGDGGHTHMPPGADGEKVSWKSLLGLGISGGLVPCPSALVVLLGAISLHRIGFGLILIVAFSLGLASVLTAIGLLFVRARHLLPAGSGRLLRLASVVGPLVITGAGLMICREALAGWDPFAGAIAASSRAPLVTGSVLGFGLVFGFKHAVEADHLAAVTTIVSQRRSLWSSSLVGGLWGVGHTLSLLVAGIVVLLFRIDIGKGAAMMLETGVGVMLVVLGASALLKLRRGGVLHVHAHDHGVVTHVHPHLHAGAGEPPPPSHHALPIGWRPLVVGMVHGLAGSSALMLVVLSTVPTALVGMIYLSLFGVGSIAGMMLMSVLVGLPFHFTVARFDRLNLAIRAFAGVFSVGFGAFMVYQIGFVDGLFR